MIYKIHHFCAKSREKRIGLCGLDKYCITTDNKCMYLTIATLENNDDIPSIHVVLTFFMLNVLQDKTAGKIRDANAVYLSRESSARMSR